MDVLLPDASSVSRIEREEWASLRNDLISIPPIGAEDEPTDTKKVWAQEWTRQLPLHRACRSGAPNEVFCLLIDHFPSAAEVRCRTIGCLPHHFVRPGKKEVLEKLLEVNPNGARQGCSQGRLPLHYLSTTHEDDVCVGALIASFPEGPKITDNNGCIPLHAVCQEGKQSPRILRALLDAYPEGVSLKDNEGKLPLHYACETGALHLVPVLLDVYPEGARQKDNYGILPFLEAVLNECELDDDDLIRLLQEYPEALFIRDDEGKFALSTIQEDEEDSLEPILKAAYPRGLSLADSSGNLPIHKACLVNAPEEAIKILFQLCPESFQKVDQNGHLPLHIAAMGTTPEALDVVDFLSAVYGAGLSLSDTSGSTPFQVACVSGSSMDIAYKLLRQWPEGILSCCK